MTLAVRYGCVGCCSGVDEARDGDEALADGAGVLIGVDDCLSGGSTVVGVAIGVDIGL